MRSIIVIVSLAAAFWPAIASAQGWPERPVRLVVPSAAGGGNDLIARIIAERFSARWSQTVVVDNRAGGSGSMGAQIVATARPDGYTLLNATGGHITINPLLRDMPYDAANAFSPITLLATAPYLMVVNPAAVQSRSVKEFIDFAKANPGQLYGSAIGSPDHLAGELFQMMTGTRLTHVPYKSSAPAVIDLLGGRLAVLFVSIPSVRPHVEAGKIRALGSSDRKRSPVLPDVPVIAEFVPGYELFTWYGLFAPAKMPPKLLARISADIREILKDPEVSQKLQGFGFDPVGNLPAEADAFIRKESKVFAKIVSSAGLREKFKE
jgi:tripartite-type tricarboxylate transporter receptor subunit TctC